MAHENIPGQVEWDGREAEVMERRGRNCTAPCLLEFRPCCDYTTGAKLTKRRVRIVVPVARGLGGIGESFHPLMVPCGGDRSSTIK